jgi:hypothetical protein
MWLHEVPRLKNAILLISGCAIAFVLGVFAVSLLLRPNHKVFATSNEGFDFRSSLDNSSGGPNVGARINLARLKMRNGLDLMGVVRNQLVMLVTVDPACRACSVASDEMRDVQNRIKPLGIKYYPVSFTASVTSPKLSSDFFNYTDSLGLITPGFFVLHSSLT